MRFAPWLSIIAIGLASQPVRTQSAGAPAKGAQPEGAQPAVDFVRDIAPIFRARCIECHGAKKSEGDLRLDVKHGLFGPDRDLWTIEPKSPSDSILFDRITLPPDDSDYMPAEGPQLSAQQVDAVRRWIEAGAVWPDGFVVRPESKSSRAILPQLEPDAQRRRDLALSRLRESGIAARLIAIDDHAVDVDFARYEGSLAGPALVARLAGLEACLARLDLQGTDVDDAALAKLGAFVALRRLDLSRTKIQGSGLRNLAKLEQLHRLNIVGTAIGDDGIAHLAPAGSLRQIHAWNSRVTDEGVAALKRANPKLLVDRGEAAAAMLRATRTNARTRADHPPVNRNCPVTNRPVVPNWTLDHRGRRIGFCCKLCVSKFRAEPTVYEPKLPPSK